MGVDMVAPADTAQCEAEGFDQSLKLQEADISPVARGESVPELLSPRTSHSMIIGSAIHDIDDKIAAIVC